MEKFITKHTPGPWTLAEEWDKQKAVPTTPEHEGFIYKSTFIYGSDGLILGEAKALQAHGFAKLDNYESNAAVLCAAPLLVSALLNILDFPVADLIGWSNGTQPITITLTPWHIKHAMEAIAAAGVVVEESKETTE